MPKTSKHPKGVPSTATFDTKKKRWDETTDRRRRAWSPGGILLLDGGYTKGLPRGLVVWHNGQSDDIDDDDAMEVAEALAKELGIPSGPPLTRRVDAQYERGELCQVKMTEADGRTLVVAHFRDGQLHGPFQWVVE